MNVTLKEAVTKWCPLVRLANELTDTGGYNRWPFAVNDAAVPQVTCMGDRCMFWVWNEAETQPRYVIAGKPRAMTEAEAGPRPYRVPLSWNFVPFSEKDQISAARWKESDEQGTARRQGSCGAARTNAY